MSGRKMNNLQVAGRLACLLVGLCLSMVGCTDPVSTTHNGEDDRCPSGQSIDPIQGECVPGSNGDGDADSDGGNADSDGGDADSDGGDADLDGGEELDPWEDESGDGIPNQFDNCPFEYNPDQLDSDQDGVGNVCDNCPNAANPDQVTHVNNPVDDRGIQMGDACAPGVEYIDTQLDSSNDGVPDVIDNCPDMSNPNQLDTDNDEVGDACDNCPNTPNPTQTASPGNPTDGRGLVVGDSCAPEPMNIPICANQSSEFERVDPNIYIALDISASMGATDTPSGQSRLEEAKDGLDAIATSLAGSIEFGLGTFPHPTNSGLCSIGHILDVSSYTAGNLQNTWSGYSPTGCTPMNLSLEDILNNNRLPVNDPTAVNAVVLIADGEPNCGTSTCGYDYQDVVTVRNTIEDLYSNGVLTFVVGFNINSPNLDEFAQAGGTGSPFLATNAGQLTAAIEDVAELLISCSYVLESPPQDPNKIWVKVDGNYLDRSEYSYDVGQNLLALSDAACTQVRAGGGDSVNLEIELGCADQCEPESPSGLLCDLYYETCGAPYPCDSCSPEVCDGQDNNCDGQIDEGCPDCGIQGTSCAADGDCCDAFVCNDGVCGHACYPTGVSCAFDSQCCTGRCGISGDTGICIEG